MKSVKTINTKQIRQDLVGFLRQLQQGQAFTVIYRSRPLVTLTTTEPPSQVTDPQHIVPGTPEALRESIRLAEKFNAGRQPKLDPNKSIKELYDETMKLEDY
ncbi:MAG TPA: hypothetical protein VK963_03660 [Candidatus Saccharimonadales bacterium]|nr:hypothetical protein [Candidatus Saccharimonadales bacterium]